MVISYYDRVQRVHYATLLLFVGGLGSRLPAGRSVGGASIATVVVGAAIVIGVIVRPIAVGVVVATTTAGIGASRGVVMVALAVSSRSHYDGCLEFASGDRKSVV